MQKLWPFVGIALAVAIGVASAPYVGGLIALIIALALAAYVARIGFEIANGAIRFAAGNWRELSVTLIILAGLAIVIALISGDISLR